MAINSGSSRIIMILVFIQKNQSQDIGKEDSMQDRNFSTPMCVYMSTNWKAN